MRIKTTTKSIILSMVLLLLLTCSIVIPAAPVKADPAPAHVVIVADPDSIPANGTSTSQITVYVEDAGHTPIAGVTVTLSTDHGTLDDTTPVTDINGLAYATLTSEAGGSTIIATVKVVVNSLKDATPVFFIPPGNPGISVWGIDLISGNGVAGYAWYGTLTLEATGDHYVIAALYAGNPSGAFLNNAFMYFDIHLDTTTNVSTVIGHSCFFDDNDNPSNIPVIIYYWDGTGWIMASNQSFVNGCITFTITADTFPNISQLGGLPFAAVVQLPAEMPTAPPQEKPFNDDRAAPTMTTPADTFASNVNVLQAQVTTGEPATVYANVVNRGDVPGGFTAVVKVNGQVEQTESYVIGAHAAQPVKFVIYRDQPGTYEVDLNGQKTSFSVVGSTAQNTPVSSTQWIFLVIIGAAVILAVVLVLLLRRRPS
jgi:hypothetical protein